jgi:hypothetical protein
VAGDVRERGGGSAHVDAPWRRADWRDQAQSNLRAPPRRVMTRPDQLARAPSNAEMIRSD